MERTEPEAFKARTLHDALHCVLDARAPPEDRILAAHLAAHVCDYVPWTEGLAAAVMQALSAGSGVPKVTETLVDVIIRKETKKAKTALPLARVARRAHHDGHHAGLYEVVVAMLAEPGWGPFVEEAWVESLLRWANGRVMFGREIAGRLLSLWLPARGAKQPWLRAILLEAPLLPFAAALTFPQRQELFCVAPSSWTWRRFAYHRAPDLELWTLARFGDHADEALDALQTAIAESEQGGDHAGAVLLAQWLADLVASRTDVQG